MKLVLGAGALIAIDRADPRIAQIIELSRRAGAELVSTSVAVGQAWRDGGRQARLARALPMIDVRPVGLAEAKQAGELLRMAGSADVVDAVVALLALPGDIVVTSDVEDLSNLLGHRGVRATVRAV